MSEEQPVAMPTVIQANKPGYKSSEFWLTAAANIFGMVMASGAFPDESGYAKVGGMIVVLLSNMGYVYGRSLVKKG